MKRRIMAGLLAMVMMMTGLPFAYEVRADAQSVRVGDIIQFGAYDWRVLDVQDGHALILTENVIEQRAYHLTRADVTWATSDIRRYLNNEFFNGFTEAERRHIRETTIINHNNPWRWPSYGININASGGPNTTDKIFLLSINEVLRYFGDSGMVAKGVDESERSGLGWPNPSIYDLGMYDWGISDQYNQARTARRADGSMSWWWLRSPGGNPGTATAVGSGGSLNILGSLVTTASSSGAGLRPALWLNIESISTPTPTPPPTQPANVAIGDMIPFGGYDWRVLDVQDGHALILTENVIEERAYHSSFTDVTWATSDIRRYLNNEFYNRFTEAERRRIRDTTVINHDNPWTWPSWGIYSNAPGGANTTDKIFLLSINEVLRYFGNSGMIARGVDERERDSYFEWPTHGIYFWGIHDQFSQARIARNAVGTASWWWLRSPGFLSSVAASVSIGGDVDVDGYYVSSPVGGVRPALWLNLESSISESTPTPSPPPTQPANVAIGDMIPFGGYDWRVLDVQDGHALILTENVIEERAYHSSFTDVTWATSDIRRYLNNEFYNRFTEAERRHIRDTMVINDDNPWFNTIGGANTTDKIFLLSINEVLQYFGDSGMVARGVDERERELELVWPTHGIYSWGIHDQFSQARTARNAAGAVSWWWLRSPGSFSGAAAGVFIGNSLQLGGAQVHMNSNGIRPALWLNLAFTFAPIS